jgi:uncharacterized protein YbaR (Trm112 family)/SAM-dependent methyltransferase
MESTVAIAMRLDLLVCPGCRVLHGDRIDVRSLEQRGEMLVCDCGRRFPIIDGVALVLADPGPYLRTEMATVVERELAPELTALLVEAGPDDEPYARLLEHLSIYLDAHWGDHAEPAPDPGFALAPLIERIAARPHVGVAVELGCSVGRMLSHVAAEHVIGIDLHVGALRRARRLHDGERVAYARRMIGRHYAAATTQAPASLAVAPSRRTLICSDVLDPPLLPDIADRVIALNMLDSVANPRGLLAVIDGLLVAGGEVILATPYQWQSATMAERERLGGSTPEATLVEILREGHGLSRTYTVEDQAEIAWTLRRDARSSVTYRTHYVRARKGT